jgi:cyclopropane fatty-acyl-phospholipid synthase-like methyltransferase
MRVLDLGCGEAGWSVRALELHPDATADAVDTSSWSIQRAAAFAEAQEVAGRLRLYESDVNDLSARPDYDLVMCVGSTHAFGGLTNTLEAGASHLRPGGWLLVGDGFWETPPDQATLDTLGMHAGELLDLAGTVELVERSGWSVVHAHVSGREEWDDYEWSWCGSLAEWALDHPSDPDSPAALDASRDHRDGWLRGYRGVLGFVCLLLRQATTNPGRVS